MSLCGSQTIPFSLIVRSGPHTIPYIVPSRLYRASKSLQIRPRSVLEQGPERPKSQLVILRHPHLLPPKTTFLLSPVRSNGASTCTLRVYTSVHTIFVTGLGRDSVGVVIDETCHRTTTPGLMWGAGLAPMLHIHLVGRRTHRFAAAITVDAKERAARYPAPMREVCRHGLALSATGPPASIGHSAPLVIAARACSRCSAPPARYLAIHPESSSA